jgi:hypothetical protein
MAKKETPESTPESNFENESPYVEDGASQTKNNWLSSRAAKITAIAVGSSLALGAAFAGGAAAGQLTGGARGGEFGMSQNGPDFDGDRHSDQDRKGGPDGQRPPHGENGPKGSRDNHGGPQMMLPPVPAPSAGTTTNP